MSSQLLGNVATVDITPDTAVAGHAQTGIHRIQKVNDAIVGIWEVKAGTVTGTPKDEVFVVISGSATVTFHVTGEVIDIGPGDIVKLNSGEENTWVVHEDLRKVYVNAGR